MRFARITLTDQVSVFDTFRWFSAATVFGAAFVFCTAAATAATINYGDFGPVPPTGTSFLSVEEGSPTNDPIPLYGPPMPFSVGLRFKPTDDFSAFTQNGGIDFTDGKLNFTIMDPFGINQVSLFEAGDYTLDGAGTPITHVVAGAIMRATVTQINGVNVAPLNLVPVNASFSDSLPGIVIDAPWSLGTAINVQAQLAALVGPNADATKVDIVINNTLIAASEANTGALIVKKEFRIDVDTDIPEPATLALAGLALCALVSIRRREL
jgi:hypothetical protein